MSTTRTFTARHVGPTEIGLTTSTVDIEVTGEDRDHAEITISTADDDGPSADAVNEAKFEDLDGHIRLTLREPNVMTTVVNGQGGVFVSGNNFGGISVQSSGDINVVSNGRHTYVNGQRVEAMPGGSAIRLTARVPRHSILRTRTSTGDVIVAGELAAATVVTSTGDVELGAVASVDIRTSTGDVTIDGYSGTGKIVTSTGDIRVNATGAGSLTASSSTGDIRTTGVRIALDGRSATGRVRQS